jgi:hypothetical protein
MRGGTIGPVVTACCQRLTEGSAQASAVNFRDFADPQQPRSRRKWIALLVPHQAMACRQAASPGLWVTEMTPGTITLKHCCESGKWAGDDGGSRPNSRHLTPWTNGRIARAP